MKKIIKIFLFIICMVLLGTSNVVAEEFNGFFEKSEIIDGIYYYKHRNDTDSVKYPTHFFHEEAYIYRDTIKHNYVYCIESWQHLTGASVGDYQVYSENHPSTNLSDEMIKRINLIAYYGYGYVDSTHNHTSPEWFAFTQMLIWRYQAPQYEHYIVDSMTSSVPITIYEEYLNEIEELISKHYVTPNIQENVEIYANDIITLNDSNNVLSYYEIVTDNNNIKARIDGNKLVIDSNYNAGTYNLKLIKRNNRFNKKMQIYTSDNYQNILEPGDEEPIEINITVKVKPHTLSIAYIDDIILEAYYDESLHTKTEKHLFENIQFQIIAAEDIKDKEGRLLILEGEEFTTYTTLNGYNKIELPEGNYIIKQQTKIPGYKMEEINVEVYHETTKIIYGTRQKPCINIVKKNEKVDMDGNSYYVPGENIEIGIYAAEDIYNYLGGVFAKKDTLLYKYQTNSEGIINTIFPELQPGKYYFKEISKLNGYVKNEKEYSFIFAYSDDFEELYVPKETIIYNNLIKTKLIILKKDSDTKKGLGGVEFSLYNKNNVLLYKGTTDSEGELTLCIPSAKYYMRETKSLDGYVKNNGLYSMTLTEEDEVFYITVFNKKEEVENKEPEDDKKEETENKEPEDDKKEEGENKEPEEDKKEEGENKEPEDDKKEEGENKEPEEDKKEEGENKEPEDDKKEEVENKDPEDDKKEEGENKEPEDDKKEEVENKDPEDDKKEEVENKDPEDDKKEEIENKDTTENEIVDNSINEPDVPKLEEIDGNEVLNNPINSNETTEEIEIIVDVPKTEKNDYLLYLLFLLGAGITILKWQKTA